MRVVPSTHQVWKRMARKKLTLSVRVSAMPEKKWITKKKTKLLISALMYAPMTYLAGEARAHLNFQIKITGVWTAFFTITFNSSLSMLI